MTYRILSNSFLGKPIDPDREYKIIGGGIAGLFCGFFLKQAGISFTIHEKTDRPGGMLQTTSTSHGVVERAANGFIWCPEIAAVCEKIGLDIIGPSSKSKARFLVRDNRLHELPIKPWEWFSIFGKLFKRHTHELETLKDFGENLLGTTITDQILEPAFAGIYGAPINNLSFPGTLPALAEGLNTRKNLPFVIRDLRKQRKASTKGKAASGTHGFIEGLEALPLALASYLSDHIIYESDGLQFIDGKEPLIITTPAYIAAEYFQDELRKSLSSVVYTPMLSVAIHAKEQDFSKLKEGFGCLIPRSEPYNILGVLFNSYIFENRAVHDDEVSLTCILREDEKLPDLLDLTDEKIEVLIQKELKSLLGFSGNFSNMEVSRWEKGIPLYSPDLYKQWFYWDESLKKKDRHINLFGNYTGQISIRGMCQNAAKITGN